MTISPMPMPTVKSLLTFPVCTMAYSFESHTGRLTLPLNARPDKTSAIMAFQAIDPRVATVEVSSALDGKTLYERDGTRWTSHRL